MPHASGSFVGESLQMCNICTNIFGLAVGFEDSNASPTAAILLSILQESIGRLATIMFAHKLGSSLEPECKQFRFAADIFNDSALILDCMSPILPKTFRIMLLCTAGTLRALCGVAGGGMWPCQNWSSGPVSTSSK